MNKEVGDKDSETVQHGGDPGVHGPAAVAWEDSLSPAFLEDSVVSIICRGWGASSEGDPGLRRSKLYGLGGGPHC